MAQAWSALGSRVTLVHRGARLIEREEEFASEQVADGLRECGGRDPARRVGDERHAERRRTVALDDGRRSKQTRCSPRSGVARRPTTSASRRSGSSPAGRSRVDDSLRVPGLDWLYAVGDVNGRALLTHMGKYQGRLAADAILGRHVAIRSDGAASRRG